MSTTKPLPIDLTKLLAPYKGQWVALSQDEKRVLGHGRSIEEALMGARKSGEEGRPLLIKVPDESIGFVLI